MAFDLPIDVKSKIVELEDVIRKKTKRIRLTGEDNLHITIKFMGEQPFAAVNRITEILGEESKKYESFTINLSKAGVFKDLMNPRVLWLGEDNGSYNRISNGLEEKLGIFRPSDNEPFCHLTIGRIKWIEREELVSVLRICNDFVKKEDLTFKVMDFYLYESRLSKGGAVYKKIEKFSLR